MFSKKATKIEENFTVDLVYNVISMVKLLSNFVDFSENIDFNCNIYDGLFVLFLKKF